MRQSVLIAAHLAALFLLWMCLPDRSSHAQESVLETAKPTGVEERTESATQPWDLGALQQRIERMIQAHSGDVGFAVKFLGPDDGLLGEFSIRGDEVMPTASLIKFPVMIEAYRQAAAGTIDLDQPVILEASDKVPGSGILTEHFSPGAQLPLRDVIRLMIRYSDNTATNMVLDEIGLESPRALMKKLDFPETQIHAKVYRRDSSIAPDRSRDYGLGSTTASDMVRLFELLHRKQLVSAEACQQMLGHLLSCEDNQKLARNLPVGATIAHKTGAVNRSRTDAGIIGFNDHKIILCVLTSENEDRSWTPDNQAERMMARMADACLKVVREKTRSKPQPTELANGSFGRLVESLQRTLNDRMDAKLSVDGDFGPATQAAVIAFQNKNEIEATGVVGVETWKALGTLRTQDDPVPAPEVVNAEVLEKSDTLRLDVAPETTAAAWAVMDLDTGEILADKNGSEARDIASTTKLMTAVLVLELADKDPTILDEIITFSERADKTPGSTSGVREGEQVSVRELLFGLLLPSGNDASVAFAEHFGSRLAEGTSSEAEISTSASYELFISAMNRRAKELGMKATHFVNPHGLTEQGHESSAIDLALLARHGLSMPSLQAYVGTRQRGCKLASREGYSRNVVWKNTNRLLAQEGFFGVKTGTTSAAGACLISAGQHASKRRVVVVLGSASSTARYVDTKNLYRWTWSQK